MAAAHISPLTQTPNAPQIPAVARQLNSTYQELDRMKRIMDQLVSGADYTALEAYYGWAGRCGLFASRWGLVSNLQRGQRLVHARDESVGLRG